MNAKVSIIITAYLPSSKPYLDECIESIRNLNYPKELIETILVTPTWYAPEYEGVKLVHPCVGQYHNPIAVNYGFNQASKDSKYLMLLNDDVILTRNSLLAMVLNTNDNDVCMGALSNCDNYGHYATNFPFGLNDRQYRLEQIGDKLSSLKTAESPFPPCLIFPNTLYLYANLFPRKVWEKVGGFDENFLTTADDTDWCMRATRAGIRLAISMNALVWHMSGVSADQTMKDHKSDERKRSHEYFKQKWGFSLV